MGQYHFTVNLDKREFLNPHKFGEGLKLWEQGWTGFGIQRGLQMLLACSDGRGGGDFHLEENGIENIAGRWAGDRIVVLGDYTEDDDLPGVENASLLWALCHPEQQEQADWIRQRRGDKLADWFLNQKPFVDISTEVRDAVEFAIAKDEGYTYQDNGGWGSWIKKGA